MPLGGERPYRDPGPELRGRGTAGVYRRRARPAGEARTGAPGARPTPGAGAWLESSGPGPAGGILLLRRRGVRHRHRVSGLGRQREKRIKAEALSTEHLEIRQLEFDYTVAAYLESVDPASYDNLVLLSSERLKSNAESDARTILGYLLLREMTEGVAKASPILVDLNAPDNVSLFENRRGEVIVTPLIISRMMARVALRRELRVVFDELFSSGGGGQLNPGRDERLRLNEDDEVTVLATYR